MNYICYKLNYIILKNLVKSFLELFFNIKIFYIFCLIIMFNSLNTIKFIKYEKMLFNADWFARDFCVIRIKCT